MNIFDFMSKHYFLTFFIVCMITETICVGFKSFGGKYKNYNKGE